MYAWMVFRHRLRGKLNQADFRPSVTILKPIAGLDERLEANLVSFFELNYEPLQLIFGCDRDNDPGIALVRKIAERYPQRDCLILTELDGPAASPKMVNLDAMLPHAKHELVLLSDSNVRIEPDDLAWMVQPMRDKRVGLVYQPVVGVDEVSNAAAVENLRLTEYPGVMSIAAKVFLFQDCVMGKGMLCRREALTSIGDFVQVRDSAADDYMIGDAIKKAGWKLCLADVPARVVHIDWGWNSFIKRHTRHAAMRWRITKFAYPLELVFMPLVVAFVPMMAMGLRGLPWTLAAIVAKMVLEAIAARALRRQPLAWRHWLMMPVKDALMLYILLRALFDNRVHWRGKTYKMLADTKLELIGVNEPEEELESAHSRPAVDQVTVGK